MHFCYNGYPMFCHAEVLLRSVHHQKYHSPVLACPTCVWNLPNHSSKVMKESNPLATVSAPTLFASKTPHHCQSWSSGDDDKWLRVESFDSSFFVGGWLPPTYTQIRHWGAPFDKHKRINSFICVSRNRQFLLLLIIWTCTHRQSTFSVYVWKNSICPSPASLSLRLCLCIMQHPIDDGAESLLQSSSSSFGSFLLSFTHWCLLGIFQITQETPWGCHCCEFVLKCPCLHFACWCQNAKLIADDGPHQHFRFLKVCLLLVSHTDSC
jgi:hypothetical protein